MLLKVLAIASLAVIVESEPLDFICKKSSFTFGVFIDHWFVLQDGPSTAFEVGIFHFYCSKSCGDCEIQKGGDNLESITDKERNVFLKSQLEHCTNNKETLCKMYFVKENEYQIKENKDSLDFYLKNRRDESLTYSIVQDFFKRSAFLERVQGEFKDQVAEWKKAKNLLI